MNTLTHDPEFNEIAETALSDYLQWFDDEPQNQTQIDEINNALKSHDYFNCGLLNDALIEWANNLNDLIAFTTNPDDRKSAQQQITLIQKYLNA